VALGHSLTAQAPTIENPDRLFLIEGNSVKAISNPYFIALNSILASLVEKDDIDINRALLLNKIIECESDWNESAINSQFGKKGGMGLIQVIPKTLQKCENALGRKLDPFNVEDSIACGIYLLNETPQGVNHWGYPDSWWGSWECWNRFVPLL